MEKELVILGGGESGTGAALLAKARGIKVFLSEKGKIAEKYRKVLLQNDIEFEENGHTAERVLGASEVIKSPGIPDSVELIRKLDEAGIPVIDEIAFAARFTRGKLIAITGSNGKTTTTLLTGHILKNAGLDVAVAGNVGDSMARQLSRGDHDYWVLELSSFQLDRITGTRFRIAAILNITPDHLDRYEYEMEKYAASKFAIIRGQTAHDHFVWFADDPVIAKLVEQVKPVAEMHPFSLHEPQDNGAWLDKEENIIINIKNKGKLKMNIQQLALQGKHNASNSMASAIISRVLDIRKEVIRESLSDFKNIPHRLETVNTISGVTYINDSKATNVNSTWFALESMTSPVVWIVGGVDKGNDYSQLQELVKDKVKIIIALGKDTKKIKKAFSGLVDEIYDAEDMRQAVGIAYRYSKKGDVVLLSPACASFDLFDSYEQRGDVFKELVRSL